MLSLLDLLTPFEVNRTFNPMDHQHQALVLLGGLQLGISLGLAIASLGVADLEFLERRLRETLHDGPASFQQKVKYMMEFSKMKGLPLHSDEAALDLHSFPLLLEVTNRLILRRNHLNDAIRLLDIATYYHAMQQPFPHAPRWILDPITQKLGADILALFIRSNGLPNEFLELFNFPSSPPQPNPQQPAAEMSNALGNGSEKNPPTQAPLFASSPELAKPNSEATAPVALPEEPPLP